MTSIKYFFMFMNVIALFAEYMDGKGHNSMFLPWYFTCYYGNDKVYDAERESYNSYSF